MRTDNNIHPRHIMLWSFEKRMTAAATFREINQIFGEETIVQSTIEDWFRRFKSGDTTLEDKPGRDRPSDFDDQALLAAVEEAEVGMVNKCGTWVLHRLTEAKRSIF